MGMHAGDLPNIDIPSSGALTFDAVAHDVTLKPGANSLLDADGAAFVIHDKGDDYKSDPAGNAGDRVICGIITK
jgi:Cu-Zn family superoxide dismutase